METKGKKMKFLKFNGKNIGKIEERKNCHYLQRK